MTDNSIKRFDDLILKILNLSPDTTTDELRYGHPANWDSIRHVEIFIGLQKEFGISFFAEEIVKLSTYSLLREAFLNKINN